MPGVLPANFHNRTGDSEVTEQRKICIHRTKLFVLLSWLIVFSYGSAADAYFCFVATFPPSSRNEQEAWRGSEAFPHELAALKRKMLRPSCCVASTPADHVSTEHP
jgi:hypothetical protein